MDGLLTLYIVDNHALLRDALTDYLEGHGNLKIIGQAGTGEDAVHGVLAARPDIVLMAIVLPDFDGIEATRQIKSAAPDIKVIAVTAHPEQAYLSHFLQAGGLGYVCKTSGGAELLKAIEKARHGEAYLSEEGVQVLVGRYQAGPAAAQDNEGPDVLSLREKQVLAGIASGYSLRVVAEKLYLSTSTVETYKNRIHEKLGLKNRAEMVTYAIRYRLFDE